MMSAECGEARAELQRALDSSDIGRSRPTERVASARKQAETACLGHSESVRERSGAPEPAQVVRPTQIMSNRAPAPPKIEGAPPPLAIPRPSIITTCDASGCWDSEGRRLNNAGPTLMGPHGLCSGSGNIVNCP
jgi:hypothetical protein